MGSFLSLSQVVIGSAADNFCLEVDVICNNFFKSEYFGLTVHQCKQDNAYRVLKLGIVIQLIQNHVCVGVSFKLHNDFHTVSVAFVAEYGDAFDTLVPHKISYIFQQSRFVYHVGDFCNHYSGMGFFLDNFRSSS